MGRIDHIQSHDEADKRTVWEEQAAEVHEALVADGKSRSLLMVVDDSKYKRRSVKANFSQAAESIDLDTIFTEHMTGEDAVGFYTSFHEQEKQDNPSHVVVIMDGDLSDPNDFWPLTPQASR